jgi:site-specific DNA-methyltransferase (adenine-specific)
MDTILMGDCLQIAPSLPDSFIDLIVTSPPYAQQRKKQYGGISELEYPQWTVNWCDSLKHALTTNGSIAIVIRPHLSKGQISDYVLRTRLAMRNAGWIEPDELIWIKPNAPPLGHTGRPRRSWESILWFSKSSKPFCDPKANGTESNRVGFESVKGVGDYKQGCSKAKFGIARCRDYVEVGTGQVDRSPENTHPAQFPEKLVSWIVKLLCPPNGVVLDPFVGSGTTLVACEELNQNGYGLSYHGMEISAEFCKIAKQRLQKKSTLVFECGFDSGKKAIGTTPPLLPFSTSESYEAPQCTS